FLYAYQLTRHASTTDYSSLAALITAVLIGTCLGFLPHNLTRARIFMGDSGAMLLGRLLAASTIAVTGQVDPARLSGADLFGQFLPILLPIGVMVIPFLDFALAVVRRIGSGRSPFHADKNHLHHRLLSLGHTKHRRADHVSVDGGDLHRVTAAAGAVTAPGGHLLGGRTADRPAHHLRPAQVALRPPPEGDQCPPSMTVGALARSGTGPCSGPRSWRSSSGWS